MKSNSRPLSVFWSLLPLFLLMIMLTVAVHTFGSDVLEGGSQISLLVVSAVCVLIGITVHKAHWLEFEKAIRHNISNTATAIIVLLVIGALSSAWMISGVVPLLIYYGTMIIRPEIFLASSCIICALVSVMTGSSWTTIATIGIALMGIGRAEGFSEGWIAGAIISGAYFGDKISPLSDTTILASSVTGVPLFSHIRYMLFTTVPSLLIALFIFVLSGFITDVTDANHVNMLNAALASRFHLSPWLLLVPLLTGVMIARRLPSLVTLFLSTVLAVLAAVIFQPNLLLEVAGEGGSVFKGAMMTLYGSTSLPTDDAMLTSLVATRGMSGMLNTIWLILCAMCFGGCMSAAGMIEGITHMFVRLVRGTASLVAGTVGAGLFFNLATADQYISILLTGNMFKDYYDRSGYERRLLSRTTEDAVTVTSVLVPWNTCGMTQSTVLGVATLTYLPYCFFNYLSPLMSILVAAIGWKIVHKSVGDKETDKIKRLA